jgi:hypothetical protein
VLAFSFCVDAFSFWVNATIRVPDQRHYTIATLAAAAAAAAAVSAEWRSGEEAKISGTKQACL